MQAEGTGVGGGAVFSIFAAVSAIIRHSVLTATDRQRKKSVSSLHGA